MQSNKKEPSILEICKSSRRTINIKLAPAKIGTSAFTRWESTFNGLKMADIPKIRAMLRMLEPTTLPRAIPPLFSIAACMLTRASGKLVPKATIVSPTISGLRPRCKDNVIEPLTNHSAPKKSNKSPPTINVAIVRNSGIYFLVIFFQSFSHAYDFVIDISNFFIERNYTIVPGPDL